MATTLILCLAINTILQLYSQLIIYLAYNPMLALYNHLSAELTSVETVNKLISRIICKISDCRCKIDNSWLKKAKVIKNNTKALKISLYYNEKVCKDTITRLIMSA